MDIPVLLLAYKDKSALISRVSELHFLGFNNIYLSLDGPTSDSGIQVQCLETQNIARKYQESGIVKDLRIEDFNLGQGKAIPRAIDWFFEINDFGLILEEDCHVSSSILEYLSEVLKLYDVEVKDKVFCFSNVLLDKFKPISSKAPYAFPLHFFSSWGWACHRSLWVRFSSSSRTIQLRWSHVFRLEEIGLLQKFLVYLNWKRQMARIRRGKQNTWALLFSIYLLQKRIEVIYPSYNLIHHLANLNSVNVKSFPKWYFPIIDMSIDYPQNFFSNVTRVNQFSKLSHRYWAKYVYGASIDRLIRGQVVKFKNLFHKY